MVTINDTPDWQGAADSSKQLIPVATNDAFSDINVATIIAGVAGKRIWLYQYTFGWRGVGAAGSSLVLKASGGTTINIFQVTNDGNVTGNFAGFGVPIGESLQTLGAVGQAGNWFMSLQYYQI